MVWIPRANCPVNRDKTNRDPSLTYFEKWVCRTNNNSTGCGPCLTNIYRQSVYRRPGGSQNHSSWYTGYSKTGHLQQLTPMSQFSPPQLPKVCAHADLYNPPWKFNQVLYLDAYILDIRGPVSGRPSAHDIYWSVGFQ